MTPAACDLNSLLPKVRPSTLLSLDDVVTTVRDVASAASAGGSRLANADPTASLKLNYAAEGQPDPYAGFDARIVPENVTLLPKTTNQATGGNTWNEKVVVAKKGETVGSILRELGALPDNIKTILAVLGARGRDGGIKEGQKLRVIAMPAGAGHVQPVRVIIASDSAIEAAVALSDQGKYVPVDMHNVDTEVADASRGRADRRRWQRRAAVPEPLRDRAAQQCAALGDRRNGPYLFL